MTAIRYLDEIPRLKGPKERVLVNAEYADNGSPIFEHYADICPEAGLDLGALDILLEGATWVGEESFFALPDDWAAGGEVWITGERSFDGNDPLEVNKALVFVIKNQLPTYPSLHLIRERLEGKQLAITGERGDITHADVLVALAAGREWKP